MGKGEFATTDENSNSSVWSSPASHLELKAWGWGPRLWAGGKSPGLEGLGLALTLPLTVSMTILGSNLPSPGFSSLFFLSAQCNTSALLQLVLWFPISPATQCISPF